MLLRQFAARIALSIMFVVAFVAAFAGSAPAGESLPFRGSLEGQHVSRRPLEVPLVFDVFELAGQANHLGRFQLVIEAVVNFGTRPPTGVETLTFTAANGDKLVADATGFSALVVPGLVLITEHATIDPDRSSGRFAGATGSFTIERLADAATGVTGVTVGSFVGTIFLATPPHR